MKKNVVNAIKSLVITASVIACQCAFAEVGIDANVENKTWKILPSAKEYVASDEYDAYSYGFYSVTCLNGNATTFWKENNRWTNGQLNYPNFASSPELPTLHKLIGQSFCQLPQPIPGSNFIRSDEIRQRGASIYYDVICNNGHASSFFFRPLDDSEEFSWSNEIQSYRAREDLSDAREKIGQLYCQLTRPFPENQINKIVQSITIPKNKDDLDMTFAINVYCTKLSSLPPTTFKKTGSLWTNTIKTYHNPRDNPADPIDFRLAYFNNSVAEPYCKGY